MLNKMLLGCTDITQPTRKQDAQLIEIYNTLNWGVFGGIRMLVIFQDNLAAPSILLLLFARTLMNRCSNKSKWSQRATMKAGVESLISEPKTCVVLNVNMSFKDNFSFIFRSFMVINPFN